MTTNSLPSKFYLGVSIILIALLFFIMVPSNIFAFTYLEPQPNQVMIKTRPPVDFLHDTEIPVVPWNVLPESGYYHIPISEQFILDNGNSLDTQDIKLTFPSSWLTDPPDMFEGAIIFRVPMMYVDQHNSSKDPAFITGTFIHDFFIGLPEPSRPTIPDELPESP